MKAVILERQCEVEQNPLMVVQKDKPKPGRREKLIKVLVCGLCYTDLDEAEGRIELAKSDITPGHQVVGVVEKTVPAQISLK